MTVPRLPLRPSVLGPSLALALLVASAPGCDCSGPTTTCTTDGDCGAGLVCRDGRCEMPPAVDGGTDGGERPDAPGCAPERLCAGGRTCCAAGEGVRGRLRLRARVRERALRRQRPGLLRGRPDLPRRRGVRGLLRGGPRAVRRGARRVLRRRRRVRGRRLRHPGRHLRRRLRLPRRGHLLRAHHRALPREPGARRSASCAPSSIASRSRSSGTGPA
ncbi:MAG: hypothetical protein M5U28_14975 [Sandaracinaceae bacterium]|nr:hypothetical protein [Sandaracinaceae bacterium]